MTTALPTREPFRHARGYYTPLDKALLDNLPIPLDKYDVATSFSFPFDEKNLATAERHLFRFMRRLNRRIYGRTFLRDKQRVIVFLTIEGVRSQKKLHCHGAFQTPSHLSREEFKRTLADCWQRTVRRKEVNQKIDDIWDGDGWIRYILKELCANNMDVISEQTVWRERN